MKENKDSTFDEYKDLYELTRRTADEYIEFYRKKESSSFALIVCVFVVLLMIRK